MKIPAKKLSTWKQKNTTSLLKNILAVPVSELDISASATQGNYSSPRPEKLPALVKLTHSSVDCTHVAFRTHAGAANARGVCSLKTKRRARCVCFCCRASDGDGAPAGPDGACGRHRQHLVPRDAVRAAGAALVAQERQAHLQFPVALPDQGPARRRRHAAAHRPRALGARRGRLRVRRRNHAGRTGLGRLLHYSARKWVTKLKDINKRGAIVLKV